MHVHSVGYLHSEVAVRPHHCSMAQQNAAPQPLGSLVLTTHMGQRITATVAARAVVAYQPNFAPNQFIVIYGRNHLDEHASTFEYHDPFGMRVPHGQTLVRSCRAIGEGNPAQSHWPLVGEQADHDHNGGYERIWWVRTSQQTLFDMGMPPFVSICRDVFSDITFTPATSLHCSGCTR